MPIFWATDILYKVAELLTKRCKDFIFIFHGVWEPSARYVIVRLVQIHRQEMV
jgi:hypothetical protein